MTERTSVTEPVRLLDGAGDDAEVALLRAATSTPPAAARDRMMALFESGGAEPADVARAAGRGPVARSHWSWIGWSSLGVTLIVAAILFARASSDAPAPGAPETARAAPAPVAAPAAPAAETAPSSHQADERESTPLVPVMELPSAAPSSTTRLSTRGFGSSTPASVTGPDEPKTNLLAEEVAALDLARRALRAGDTAGAQRALGDYDRRFPGGILAPEAALLRVEALLVAGDETAARRIGEEFLAKGPPNGAYVGRMRSLLQTAGRTK
jgi:TolA-binding protein